jgi:hypothetical protein
MQNKTPYMLNMPTILSYAHWNCTLLLAVGVWRNVNKG